MRFTGETKQSLKPGRSFLGGFGLEIDKMSGLARASHTYLPIVLAFEL